jgi:hypothetical protein
LQIQSSSDLPDSAIHEPERWNSIDAALRLVLIDALEHLHRPRQVEQLGDIRS